MKQIDHKLIGKRIQEIRAEKKVTQEELAWDIETSASYISRIETGTKKASLNALCQIANMLGVTICRFLYGNQPHNLTEYRSEWNQLIADCTSDEKRILYGTVLELKRNLRMKS